MEGNPKPADGNRPEDWLCSTTVASNPGCDLVPDEGLSHVIVGGRQVLVRDLLAHAPTHYLGGPHYQTYGLDTGFLAKLIDSAIRLPLQAHPTREFAKRKLGKPWGKFECYVILSVRPGVEPYFYLGFQRPPTAQEWLRIVTEQDLRAMMACFEKVPIHPGEVWYIPGGFPHALGEGLTLLEFQEPSDLCVRCEFERDGVVVPEEARFMGLMPCDALQIFNYECWPLDLVRQQFRVTPKILNRGRGVTETLLIGPEQIDCFEVRELSVDLCGSYELEGRLTLAVATAGKGRLSSGKDTLQLGPGKCCLIAAAADQLKVEAETDDCFRLLLCMPGRS
jgi:mannose-6-phosphate isomerase